MNDVSNVDLIELLKFRHAWPMMIGWVKTRTLRQVWKDCDNPEWLLWLVARVIKNVEYRSLTEQIIAQASIDNRSLSAYINPNIPVDIVAWAVRKSTNQNVKNAQVVLCKENISVDAIILGTIEAREIMIKFLEKMKKLNQKDNA